MEISNLGCIIPGEMMVDILLRLPVRQLLKFRIVCKSWNSLTRDPAFAQQHHSKASSSSSTVKNHTNLVLSHSYLRKLPQVSVLCSDKTSQKIVPLPFLNERLLDIQLYGPCNGIICLYDRNQDEGDGFAFWNPATRETKVLPLSMSHRYIKGVHFSSIRFGFEYDRATDDYKLFRIQQGSIPNDHPSILKNEYIGIDVLYEISSESSFVQRVEVYSLNENAWKFIKTSKKLNIGRSSQRFKTSPHVYLNGFCYWLGGSEEKNDYIITSCDTTNEEFCEIEAPAEEVLRMGAKVSEVELIEVKEHLCLIWQEPYKLIIWAMANKQWRKHKVIELAIQNYTNNFDDRYVSKYNVLMIRRNGDIILQAHWRRTLKLYDQSAPILKNLPLFHVSDSIDHMVYCKESLVPLQRTSSL